MGLGKTVQALAVATTVQSRCTKPASAAACCSLSVCISADIFAAIFATGSSDASLTTTSSVAASSRLQLLLSMTTNGTIVDTARVWSVAEWCVQMALSGHLSGLLETDMG